MINIDTLIAPGIAELNPYRSARDEFSVQDDSYTFLDANEHPEPSDVNRYPDPYQTNLRRQISNLKNIDKEQILLGNGSDELLDMIFRVFCEPGDTVITLPPTYGMYEVLAKLHRVDVEKIPLDEQFQPVVPEILSQSYKDAKILFLCSPNNPTGNLIAAEKLTQLLENFQGMVVVDEAYIDFSESESWAHHCASYPNLIVLQTFSKAYGMAGIRLGMVVANPKVISWLRKVKLPYNVNVLTQNYAQKHLKDSSKIKDTLAIVQRERALLSSELAKIPFVETVFPSEANFLLVRMRDANSIYKKLLDNGVVVRNRSSLPGCEDCLRITIGTPDENKKLINLLQNSTL